MLILALCFAPLIYKGTLFAFWVTLPPDPHSFGGYGYGSLYAIEYFLLCFLSRLAGYPVPISTCAFASSAPPSAPPPPCTPSRLPSPLLYYMLHGGGVIALGGRFAFAMQATDGGFVFLLVAARSSHAPP